MDHDSSYLRTSRHYQAIMESKIIADEAERQRMKTFACLYCILAPYDNEQQDMMLKLDKSKQLDDSPLCKELLRLFMCKELIDFGAMESVYGKELLSFEIFDQSNAHGKKCWTELKNRVIEHVSLAIEHCLYAKPTKLLINVISFRSLFQNIRIISNYYTRINLNRLCDLLKLPAEQTEEYLSLLANNNALTVKIDRPSGIIHFSTKKATSDILNDWAFDINKLMDLVNKTCHLINKEECINNVLVD